MRSLLVALLAASIAAAIVVAGAAAGPPAPTTTRATAAHVEPAAHTGAAEHAQAAKRRHSGRRHHKRHHPCDPNYRGRCLRPHVSDYDCKGGGGDGPYYVRGPFRVVGRDHYRLDADHDGIACE